MISKTFTPLCSGDSSASRVLFLRVLPASESNAGRYFRFSKPQRLTKPRVLPETHGTAPAAAPALAHHSKEKRKRVPTFVSYGRQESDNGKVSVQGENRNGCHGNP